MDNTKINVEDESDSLEVYLLLHLIKRNADTK